MLFDELRIFLTSNFGQQFDEVLFEILNEMNMEVADFEHSGLGQRQEIFFKILENNEKLRQDPIKTWELKQVLRLSKKDETKIIDNKNRRRRNAIESFREKLKKAYFKESLILDMYVAHSVEAELKGANHESVIGVIKKALSSIPSKIEEEYCELQEQFEVPRELRLKKNMLATSSDKGNHNYNEIFTLLAEFWNQVLSCFSEFERLIIETQEQSVQCCQGGQDYNKLIQENKIKIRDKWNGLMNHYSEFMKKSGLEENEVQQNG